MLNITEKEIMQNWERNKYNKPEVTIWCIAFNHEKFIAQCLDSFLMQKTNFPFEIVVHDDASCDCTADIICKYAECFPTIVRVIVEEKNVFSMGESVFGRVMLDNVRAKYVATCEGDDYWSNPYKLQIQHDFMEKNKEYSMVGHLTKSIDQNNNRITTFVNSVPGEYDKKMNGKWQFFAHYSSYFYKNVFMDMTTEECDKYFDVPIAGDRKLPVLLMKYGRLFVLPEEMSVYRYMSCPTSYTAQMGNRSMFDIYMEWEGLFEYTKNLGIDVDNSFKENELLCQAFGSFVKGRYKDLIKIMLFRKRYIKDVFVCIEYALNRVKRKLQKTKI